MRFYKRNTLPLENHLSQTVKSLALFREETLYLYLEIWICEKKLYKNTITIKYCYRYKNEQIVEIYQVQLFLLFVHD